ncbi:MAG: transcriptional regulator [Bdellovibrionales bacterium]
MPKKTGTFKEFKAFTLAVARGQRGADPQAPKIWCEPASGARPGGRNIRFHSFEAGAKLLSAKNRILMRAIAKKKPDSVTALAHMTGRAEQNVLRTLKKLEAAGIVRFDKGTGRARRPVLTARKIHFEIDLIGAQEART